MIVHIIDCLAYLPYILLHFLLFKTGLFFQSVVKITTITILRHEIYMLRVIKTGIEAGDVRMIQKSLNFYLAYELFDVVRITFKNIFWYFFESAEEISSNMPKLDCDYFAKWTEPNCPYFIKCINLKSSIYSRLNFLRLKLNSEDDSSCI